MKCPVCEFESDDSDVYLGHLVEHKREMLAGALNTEFEKLNLLHPQKFLSREEFVSRWTAANEEQAEGRFKRK